MRPILVVVFVAASAFAQKAAPPAFDVASVKISQQFNPEDRGTWGNTIEQNPGTLTMRNCALARIVAWAYDTQIPQVVAPDWAASVRYDIVAKVGHAANETEMRPMLQALLAERFKLATHREKRPLDVMAMLLPKGQHKMTPSKVEGDAKNHQDPERGLVIEGAALSDMASEISRELGTTVVDMTGLTGRFDFTFNTAKYVTAIRSRIMAEGRNIPDSEVRVLLMQDVIAGELGLRLEPRRAPVDVVVIDRAEKTPVEN